MDAEAEEIVIPFLIGLAIGAGVVGVIAAGVIDGARDVAYRAGLLTGVKRRTMTTPATHRLDLVGDEGTELGKFN